MRSDCRIEPAGPDLEAALRLAFQGEPEVELAVRNALDLIERGELDPAGMFVARTTAGLRGALICLTAAGACGILWPPQVTAGAERTPVEDALVEHGRAWLRDRGAKLTQALLLLQQVSLAAPLERNGFVHVTSLCYLRHDLLFLTDPSARLDYQTYNPANPARFHTTLLESYEGTLDVPELNGVRTVDEVIAGHQAPGRFDPCRWWLALADAAPVGVLLLTEMPDWPGWDLAYLGVVPAARRRGLGRELARKALWEARHAGGRQLCVTVDARNQPARRLYEELGFVLYDRREVYLALERRADV